jgi:hypothetical protein
MDKKFIEAILLAQVDFYFGCIDFAITMMEFQFSLRKEMQNVGKIIQNH